MCSFQVLCVSFRLSVYVMMITFLIYVFTVQIFKLVPANDEENALAGIIKQETQKQASKRLSEVGNTKKQTQKRSPVTRPMKNQSCPHGVLVKTKLKASKEARSGAFPTTPDSTPRKWPTISCELTSSTIFRMVMIMCVGYCSEYLLNFINYDLV